MAGDFFGIGGSSSGGSSRSTEQPILPPWFGNYGPIKTEVGQLTSGLTSGGIPSISSLISGFPQLGIAPLTPDQLANIQQFLTLGQDPFAMNPQESAAGGLYSDANSIYNELSTGGPARNFVSPLTGFSAQGGSPNAVENQAAAAFTKLLGGPNVSVPYGEKVFSDITTPQVMSQAALMGLGNSGAATENLAMAGEAMALPMAEQGLNLELSGAQGLSGLGTAEQNAQLAASAQNLSALTSLGNQDLSALGLRTSAMENAASGISNLGVNEANLGAQMNAQGVQNLKDAMVAAGIPQQQAQNILMAQYQKQLGASNLAAKTQGDIMSWIPAALTGRTTTDDRSSSGFNWDFNPFAGSNGGPSWGQSSGWSF